MRRIACLFLLSCMMMGCQADRSLELGSEYDGQKPKIGNQDEVKEIQKFLPYQGKPAKNIRSALADRGVHSMLKDTAGDLFKEVHIYHSSVVRTKDYIAGGGIHARMLANLVGHYRNVNVKVLPISKYTSDKAKSADHVFYIGTVYNESVPKEFIHDVKLGNSIVWINYNIWQLDQQGMDKVGIKFDTIHTASSPESYKKMFDKVEYKKFKYNKKWAPMEMIQVSPQNDKVEVLAKAINSKGKEIPYALKSGNFWYIADNPFVYIHPTDRYLVMADLIHNILGSKKKCEAKAILRLEDLGAGDNPSGLKNVLDVIEKAKIPFAMTVIPRYQYDGVQYSWKKNSEMLNLLYRGLDIGGVPIQHGDLHAYEGLKNPTGNSGDDWEFWNHKDQSPIAGLTPDKTEQRIKRGRDILLDLGIYPLVWTTPHYEADTKLYTAINNRYPNVLERRMYKEDGVISGQFFPYIVKDTYGSLVYPENLGNVQMGYGVPEILSAARANRNLHCPTASLFIHPYLFIPEYQGEEALKPADLAKMLNDIKEMGYKFVSPLDMQLSVAP